ncbi:hypothetical protein MYMA111404_03460 [Mycoplasma marinum]|uniref:Uncharacterized protein n=1 Tax=Mycoplasma marinum TaxID=1937190 RepID=A0A4R0XRK7_9MOLU|nr:hypothetical protein [Mycoplasma marinum]TCG11040.1 hypothetical protein C4B24_03080 [Mycoplasma marinum]
MLIKEMIKKYKFYNLNQPLSLSELKAYIKKEYNKEYSPAAIRNILLDNQVAQLNYFSSYVRGVYLPFEVNNEEELVRAYSETESFYPIGRYLATKLNLSNQAFYNGSYIVFSNLINIRHIEKLVTQNNYYFVEGLTTEEQKKMLLLIELMNKIEYDVFIEYNEEIEQIMNWYEQDYQNILKKIKVNSIINNNEFRNIEFGQTNKGYSGHVTKTGSIFEWEAIPKAFDFKFIGVMKVLKQLRGKNE